MLCSFLQTQVGYRKLSGRALWTCRRHTSLSKAWFIIRNVYVILTLSVGLYVVCGADIYLVLECLVLSYYTIHSLDVPSNVCV